MNAQVGPRGLSSRVSNTSHGSGGAFSVKEGMGGGLKQRKASTAGSATFSHSLMNLTQVSNTLKFGKDISSADQSIVFRLLYVVARDSYYQILAGMVMPLRLDCIQP